MLPKFTIDPDAKLDFGFNWTKWLVNGETIVTSTWLRAPEAGLTLSDASTDGTSTAVWCEPGEGAAEAYTVTNRVVTSAGREDDRSFRLVLASR